MAAALKAGPAPATPLVAAGDAAAVLLDEFTADAVTLALSGLGVVEIVCFIRRKPISKQLIGYF